MIISLLEKEIPYIDVRAPIEFAQGALPTSKNLPILIDKERERVGKAYKKSGGQAATELGYILVKDEIKDQRVDDWVNFVNLNPNAHLYCARGGQRSEIAIKWLKERGVEIPRIHGGFKTLRNSCLKIITDASNDNKEWIIIAGKTGSNKTGLVTSVPNAIDLEGLANHRGSAFGGYQTPQPTPINFENTLAIKYLKISQAKIFFEDEPDLEIFLRRNSKSRRITLRISALDGKITITGPNYISFKEFRKFAESKKSWLKSKIKSFLKLFLSINNLAPLIVLFGAFSPPIASIAIVIFFFMCNN